MKYSIVGAVCSAAVVLVSCSSSNTASPTTAVPSTIATAPVPEPSTTVPESTIAATTTTAAVVAAPSYPLTGLPIVDPVAAARPALVVKIDNNAAARPQSGLNAADIVFEEIVEVQTRFAAVFQSQASDPVGPIRSGRTQDIDLLGMFNRPLLAWSGGNGNVTNAIRSSDLINLSAQDGSVYRAGGYFRSSDRKAPHNLYAQSTALWTLAPAGATPPPPIFDYLEAGDVLPGTAASGIDLVMSGLSVEWRFDPASASYLRTNAGKPHNDAALGQVSTQNVVVMVVDYRPSSADANSPEAQTVGSGQALVISNGVVQVGTWTRADRLSPIVLVDAAGSPLELSPGRTWVELAVAGTFNVVT